MLALIAGTGDLPAALAARLSGDYIVCALDGFPPGLTVDIPFRIEHLGSFLNVLADRGVTEICMAGAIRRPPIDPGAIDPATVPLVPRIQAAIAAGDDGALRTVMSIFEERGFVIRAAHDIAPNLLPEAGVLTDVRPRPAHHADAARGEATIAEMGAADSGQACIICAGQVIEREGIDGTDAMLLQAARAGSDGDVFGAVVDGVSEIIDLAAGWLSGPDGTPLTADRGILFKAPKPDQDRRVDLPVIGPETARHAAAAGLAGIVIEAGGVMILNRAQVIATLNQHDMFLWVRPKGSA